MIPYDWGLNGSQNMWISRPVTAYTLFKSHIVARALPEISARNQNKRESPFANIQFFYLAGESNLGYILKLGIYTTWNLQESPLAISVRLNHASPNQSCTTDAYDCIGLMSCSFKLGL